MAVFQYGLYSRKEGRIKLIGIVSKWSLISAFNLIEKRHRADGSWDDADTIPCAIHLTLWRLILVLLPFNTSTDFGGWRFLEKCDGKWEWYEQHE